MGERKKRERINWNTLKKLGHYLAAERWYLLVAVCLAVAGNLLSLAGPMLSGYAVDAISPGPGRVDFERVFYALQSSVDPQIAGQAAAWAGQDRAGQERSGEAEDRYGILSREIAKAIEAAGSLRKELWTANARYRACLGAGDEEGAMAEWEAARPLRIRSMKAFQKEQDWLVRLNWHDEVLFPQEASQNNLRAILRARERLDAGDVSGALEAIYEIDNNR